MSDNDLTPICTWPSCRHTAKGQCKGPISALPAVQPAHVNETPKSEHDTANMLTLAAERDRLAAAVDAVMADRKRIIEERDRGFVMVMERAETAEAEVARLTALLPHPSETAQEVMWRNFQRGVRLEELAKTAGVTRERARQMVRKAEARLAEANSARLREAANGLRKAAEDLDGYVGRGYGDEYLELADSLSNVKMGYP